MHAQPRRCTIIISATRAGSTSLVLFLSQMLRGPYTKRRQREREYLLACPPARARARDETNPRRKTTPYRSTGPFWYEREQHDLSVQETGGQQPWAGAVWNHVLTLADVLPDGTKPYVPAARERAFQRASSSASCISLRLPRAVTYVLITCVIRADTMWSVPYHGHSLGNQVARQRGEYFPAGTGDLVLSV
jgi:hypothetical protein